MLRVVVLLEGEPQQQFSSRIAMFLAPSIFPINDIRPESLVLVSDQSKIFYVFSGSRTMSWYVCSSTKLKHTPHFSDFHLQRIWKTKHIFFSLTSMHYPVLVYLTESH
ncbi:hypothetical protein CHARACLAT_006641 [Characodon lateralis]|uniref:Uncharacterized protein n=1 Tax=Characodon lateralis TaxID=208331 RepID=A0ABU7D6L3_9TELE|nr:hypothetical protein [Characodon lateralis]